MKTTDVRAQPTDVLVVTAELDDAGDEGCSGLLQLAAANTSSQAHGDHRRTNLMLAS